MEFVFLPNLSELRAANCGIAILSPGWIHRRRNINTSVFILGHQGKVEIQEESEVFTIKPSSFCLLSEGRGPLGNRTDPRKGPLLLDTFQNKGKTSVLIRKRSADYH
ncbi:hypothetical protein [uncultured Sphaerochaeta sp.]|uniref:hypothetical protein n=1 Tax=uncultured Sphaerochaeta sp. TaxID=886478 RepID=UPI002A0A45D1|nr:hypothetical protein [uncultured Sphaerochaeta sp.]